uniref:Integrase catalytic domain-containing protein n=1 Tax=Anopheles dirus TaxID=7168 RepID=A0A182NDP4_9DIPT
ELDGSQSIIELNSRHGSLSTLRLVWNSITDTLSVKISETERSETRTKLSIIRAIAKMYDPLGIVDTVKAKANQFMQRVWTLKKANGWDEEVPQQLRQEWEKFERQLVLLRDVQIPRHVTVEGARNIQIHGFSDASESGYGACVYVRSSNEEGVVSRLYVSKSKVTPLATKHSIAKLELCAAHLLSKLLVKIGKATEDSFPTFCWTDSTTVIHWLKSPPSRWKTFVANRVSQIQTATKKSAVTATVQMEHVTSPVHIELVTNLTSSAFLAALRWFIARRGKVAELHSDNGTNFRGASNELQELYKLLNSQEHQKAVSGWCAEHEIRWKFTPPAAPHFGGLWEATVKSMKFHLKRVLGTGQLTYEDLSTLLTEIEACLNSRPLTAISEDPNDVEALTPGHFLVENNLQTLPDLNMLDIPTNRLNHWKLLQRHMQHIWQRWHLEYLHTLQKRSKWNNTPCTIMPGKLVVLQEDNVAVCKWPLARIIELHPGKDGVTRVVSLKVCNGKTIRRPIHKIALLPME